MTEQIKALLPYIQDHPIFETYDFRLVGGTALSYHIGHRLSEDLDFCIIGELPRDALEAFIEHCVDTLGMDNIEYIEPTQAMVEDFLIGGDRVERYLQTWMVGGVKLQFFDGSSNLGTRELFADDRFTTLGTIKVASLETIFKMKSLMFYKRTKARDLFDMLSLYALKNDAFTPLQTKTLIQQYDRLYYDNHSFHELWLKSFAKKTYVPLRDEGLTGLTSQPRTFQQMRQELVSLFEKL